MSKIWPDVLILSSAVATAVVFCWQIEWHIVMVLFVMGVHGRDLHLIFGAEELVRTWRPFQREIAAELGVSRRTVRLPDRETSNAAGHPGHVPLRQLPMDEATTRGLARSRRVEFLRPIR
jgi:hypothetical protein